jgi:UDP-N-acetylglucosamine transferase subunit ALG13
MIFVTVGSQKTQFNRLLRAIDEQVSRGLIKDEIFAQTGSSDYCPVHYGYNNFIDRDKYVDKMNSSEIVITHGGTGAIIGAVKKGKKVIAVPRLKKYSEHVDDHQLEIVQQFESANLIIGCHNCDEIWKYIETARTTTFNTYSSSTNQIIDSIELFIFQMKV